MAEPLPFESLELRKAMIEVLSNQLRTRVYTTIFERPGVTIKQIAERIGEPPRRVRHQVELLIESGLVEVDSETPKRNTRERHYLARWTPTVFEEDQQNFTDEQRRKIATSVLRMVIADVGVAIRNGSFGTGPGHAVIRVPGEVDRQGWNELSQIMVATTEKIEAAMSESAKRLRGSREEGIETISALLLFETAPWGPTAGDEPPPRSLPW